MTYVRRRYGDYEGDEDSIYREHARLLMNRFQQGGTELTEEDLEKLKEAEINFASQIENQAAKEGGHAEDTDKSRFTKENYPDSIFFPSSTVISEPSDVWDNK